VVGGLISSIFDLASGDPAKKQENQLQGLGDYETGIGETGTTAALKYDLGLLSGDPTQLAETMAPEISAGQQQLNQQQKTLAEFAPRSGGTAAQSNAARSQEQANIINLEGGLRSRAAEDAGRLGTADLSMASGNINDVANLRTARQQQVAGDVGGIASGAASIISGLPMGGGSDPFETLYNAQHPDRSSIGTESPDLGASGYILE
jgi:hypothetical protein